MVGAGIGGTAAAFYLREEFGPSVKIDVFEPGDVGGRLATVKIGDYEYETGGAVIHPLNLHMKHFIDKLGKNQRFSNTETCNELKTQLSKTPRFVYVVRSPSA